MNDKGVGFALGSLIPRDLVLLNGLSEAAAAGSHPRRLDLTPDSPMTLTAMSILGEASTFSQRTLTDIMNRPGLISFMRSLEPEPIKAAGFLGSLGHLICGLNRRDADLLLSDPDAADFVLTSAGNSVRLCPKREILDLMAEKAVELYGDPAYWKPSRWTSLGVITEPMMEPVIIAGSERSTSVSAIPVILSFLILHLAFNRDVQSER